MCYKLNINMIDPSLDYCLLLHHPAPYSLFRLQTRRASSCPTPTTVSPSSTVWGQNMGREITDPAFMDGPIGDMYPSVENWFLICYHFALTQLSTIRLPTTVTLQNDYLNCSLQIDSTPYLSVHLSPPSGPSWRRCVSNRLITNWILSTY